MSQARFESVQLYLIENDIEEDRVMAHGYGESEPKTTNETEEGHATNRRMVFTILEK